MIKTRKDLKEYLEYELPLYTSKTKKDRMLDVITRMPNRLMKKYIKLLRVTEYHYNNRNKPFHAIMYLIKRRRKNALGQRFGVEIFENTFGKGLHIFHFGNIVINGNATVGENCKLHGSNCIGNDGYSSECPKIGNNVRLGVGAKIIGGVTLADNITVAAGAVVVHSFLEDGITIGGVPARKIK